MLFEAVKLLLATRRVGRSEGDPHVGSGTRKKHKICTTLSKNKILHFVAVLQ
jgi:hypothetical protein